MDNNKIINYNNDVIEIDLFKNTIKSKNNKTYNIITDNIGNIQFLNPEDNKDIIINIETEEITQLTNEDDLEF